MIAIPITSNNLHCVATSVGISADELQSKVEKSKLDYKKEQDMKYILDFFNADEQWYLETKEKVNEIDKSLPEDLDHKERIIKMYGWIKNDTKISGSLNIPFRNPEYGAASSIEMVFNGQIDMYLKIINWD